MATIKEMLKGRITELNDEIDTCKRALAAIDANMVPIDNTPAIHLQIKPKQTLADIITVLLNDGSESRSGILDVVKQSRPRTNAQTISGTLNNMQKAGKVKLKNGKWNLIKP